MSYIRSENNWVVKEIGDAVEALTARVEADPVVLLSTNSWLFNNGKEDPSLTCSLPSTSPPCCLTVTLSGAAKEAHGDCEGEYKSTGLISMGRPVDIICRKSG